ncbi:MAG: hypothetical protein KC586_30385 [Myxococcales bacterium]|nr:hypothetical protein [Myxococcales bacterium]
MPRPSSASAFGALVLLGLALALGVDCGEARSSEAARRTEVLSLPHAGPMVSFALSRDGTTLHTYRRA